MASVIRDANKNRESENPCDAVPSAPPPVVEVVALLVVVVGWIVSVLVEG